MSRPQQLNLVPTTSVKLFELWRACLVEVLEGETVSCWIYRGALEVLLGCVDVATPSNARSAQFYVSN
jgi:hypothetical protein